MRRHVGLVKCSLVIYPSRFWDRRKNPRPLSFRQAYFLRLRSIGPMSVKPPPVRQRLRVECGGAFRWPGTSYVVDGADLLTFRSDWLSILSCLSLYDRFPVAFPLRMRRARQKGDFFLPFVTLGGRGFFDIFSFFKSGRCWLLYVTPATEKAAVWESKGS
jgi:hypothetical protein